MTGRNGFVLVLFGGLVWLANWVGLSHFRDLDPRVAQAIALAAAFGCALIIVAVLIRLWNASAGAGNE